MKVKPIVIVVIVIAIVVGGILLSMALGAWTTEEKKEPAKNADGSYIASDIRGSYTFGNVSQYYNIPLDSLASAFGVDPANAESFRVSDVSTLFGGEDADVEIGTGAVKLFVAFYLGQETDLGDSSTMLPAAAVQVLRMEGKPTEQQIAYMEMHKLGDTVDSQTAEEPTVQKTASATEQQPTISAPAEKSTEPTGSGSGGGSGEGNGDSSELTDVVVKGSSYLKDIADEYAIPLDDIAAAFRVSKAQAPFFQAKDVRDSFADSSGEIGVNSIRMFVALYIGSPYDLSGTTAMQTAEGVEILKSQGNLTQEQMDYLDNHTLE